MKDEKHARMVKSWVKSYIEVGIPFEIEVPYNFFGDRGFVDLVVHGKYEMLYEFKTRIEDLGEIIRQFKRMITFYPKCRTSFKHYTSMLILLDTPENMVTFQEYREMFNGLNVCFYNPQSQRVTYLKTADNQHFNSNGRIAATPTPSGGGS